MPDAIKRCLKEDVLTEYLIRKARDINTMFLGGEYNFQDELDVAKEEAYEDGLIQGADKVRIETALRMISKGMDDNIIADMTGLFPWKR